MNNLTIRAKLIAGFGVLIFVFAGLIIFSITRMNRLAGLTADMYHHPFQVTNACNALDASIAKIRVGMKELASARNSSEVTLAVQVIRTEEEKVTGFLNIMDDRFLGDKQMVSDIKSSYDQWKSFYDQTIGLAQQGVNEEVVSRTLQAGSYYANVKLALERIHNFSNNKAIQFNTGAQDTRQFTLTIMYSLFFTALVFTILFAMAVISSIIKPINRSNAVIEQLSEGNLNIKLETTSNDEIAQMINRIAKMANIFKQIMSNVLKLTDNLISASVEFNNSAQAVSNGASTQASSSEEISASVEEMSANIEQNTENAQTTQQIASHAAQGIAEINSAAEETTSAMKNIASKITIISEIAFQTNLLALNAAVEAARAGEHGKGFAVVAAEIRKLAERSKKAASEINEISRDSVTITEKTGNMMRKIAPDIEKTSLLVKEIASASIEQTTGVDQINNAIQQLNRVTQANASSAEEMASLATELVDHAQELKNMVGFFKF